MAAGPGPPSLPGTVRRRPSNVLARGADGSLPETSLPPLNRVTGARTPPAVVSRSPCLQEGFAEPKHPSMVFVPMSYLLTISEGA
jgi:hypothetical protein